MTKPRHDSRGWETPTKEDTRVWMTSHSVGRLGSKSGLSEEEEPRASGSIPAPSTAYRVGCRSPAGLYTRPSTQPLPRCQPDNTGRLAPAAERGSTRTQFGLSPSRNISPETVASNLKWPNTRHEMIKTENRWSLSQRGTFNQRRNRLLLPPSMAWWFHKRLEEAQ